MSSQPSKLLVTSWGDKGYEQYGRVFLESWKEHWSSVPLLVFHEGHAPELDGPLYLDLRDETGLREFHERWGMVPEANGVVKTADGQLVCDYRWQACKFARKVFAITSGRIPTAEWRIWIDADVVFKRPPDERLWDYVTPEGCVGSYIGRIDWHHSECGWVAYKMPDCRKFLDRFRDLYATARVFEFSEWHDSYVFDHLMQESTDCWRWRNLADGVRGMHPWPNTILGEYMDHHKGPVAKKEFYG